MHETLISEAIYQEMCLVMPGGVNSPMRACREVDHTPMIVASGKEDCVFDIEGNRFIDYCGSWGALIHGHANRTILNAVQKRIELGTSFGIATQIEGELAKKVVEMVPGIEKIRLVCSGTEATMSAARLARGFTGRDLIVKFDGNYHGHADFFLVKAGSGVTHLSANSSSAGIPEAVVQHVASLPYNDVEAARSFLSAHSVAAVILEPVAGNMGVVPASGEFIAMLRRETERQNALLIFDEVITGFRVGRRGAQSLYHVQPDLICLGKILGGGFPLAAFGGRADVMRCLAPEGHVYQAGTLAGNPVAVEAGLQALTLLEMPEFYDSLEKKTALITEPIVDYIEQRGLNACLQRQGSMFMLFFGVKSVKNQQDAKRTDSKLFARFFRYMYQNGVYIPPSQFEAWFISSAHSEEHLIQKKNRVLEFLREVF